MCSQLIILRSQYGHSSDYSEVTVWTQVYQRLCQTVDCKHGNNKNYFLKVVNIVFKLERGGGGGRG